MSDTPKPDHIMQFFKYDHLPEKMQAVSKPFGDLAQRVVEITPQNPERTAALRKLLEAKDCAVRALIAVALAVMFLPSLALAQAAVTTAPPTTPDSFSALLLQHVLAPVLTALGGLLAWALKALVDYLKEKGKESKTLNIVAVLTESVRSMVAHLNATLRPQLEAALADGVLTDAEKTKLKETAIETVKKSLPAATLNTAKSIFGDFLDPFLAGLVERAVLDQKAAAAVANPPAP